MKKKQTKFFICFMLLFNLLIGASFTETTTTLPVNKEFIFNLLIPILQPYTQNQETFDEKPSIESAMALNLSQDLNKNVFVNREQLASIFVRALEGLEIEGEKPLVYAYKNVDFIDRHLVSKWAQGYVTLALNNEIMSLDKVGAFSPQNFISEVDAKALISNFENHLQSKLYEKILLKQSNDLAYNLNQALILGANSRAVIRFDLMELIGKSQEEVIKRLGNPSNKGFYKWMGYEALAYKNQKLMVYFDKNRVIGFSIDNSEKNSTFNGKVGFLKRSYDMETVENEFKGIMHVDGIDEAQGLYVYEVFSELGTRYIELIWNQEKEYCGLVYFAKAHEYKPYY